MRVSRTTCLNICQSKQLGTAEVAEAAETTLVGKLGTRCRSTTREECHHAAIASCPHVPAECMVTVFSPLARRTLR